MNITPKLLDCLPLEMKRIINNYEAINEIRISKGCPMGLTVGNKTLITDYVVSGDELEFCLQRICKSSMHTYFDSIKKGYIPFDEGYRIGVCGKAVTDDGNIRNISEITSINIRIPTRNYKVPKALLNTVSHSNGILVYSPANIGKTTFLKALINHLSSPPHNKRMSVIDCKGELYTHKNNSSIVDYFVGYPKYDAINMAIQNMSPEIIVCDEIGLTDDVSPFVECANCGVCLICSAHAVNSKQIMSRKNIRKLIDLGVFEAFVGIKISHGERIYDFKKREDLIS